MQEELRNLESNDLKEWQGLIIEARKVTSNFLHQVNEIEEQLAERAKEFDKKVDEIIDNAKKELNELKTTNLDVLYEQEEKVSEGLEKVKQEIKKCEDRLRSTDIISLLEYEVARNDKEDILPAISSVAPPVLTPSQTDTKVLTEMIGHLSVLKTRHVAEGHSQSQKSSTTDTAKTKTVQETTKEDETIYERLPQASPRDTQDHGDTAATNPSSQLFPKPSIQSELRTKTECPSVACVGPGQAWVKTEKRMIQLMDIHGSVYDTIHTNFGFVDMVLSPHGDLLLCDYENKLMMSISVNKNVKKLIKVKWKPYGMCCLQSGNIAVTFLDEGRVIIYSVSGKIIKELDKKLFRRPYKVAQSKTNSYLYISDIAACKVLALDKDYRVRYDYTGQGDRGSFVPRGLCTDKTGRVLITDSTNHRVDIVDGRFPLYLQTGEQGLRRPWSIDVDSEGNIWVGELEGDVKVMKYLQ